MTGHTKTEKNTPEETKSGVRVDTLVLGPFGTNTYVVTCTETGKAVVIDPGFQGDRIAQFVKDNDLNVVQILITHGHVDHASAMNSLLKELKPAEVATAIHEDDLIFLERLPEAAAAFGLSAERVQRPTRLLKDGDIVEVGNLRFLTIHTPGHSPGGAAFLLEEENIVFVGDTLFCRGIGRTDLPGGSYRVLESSIMNRLYILDPSTKVYTGHGPPTTIREEKSMNPFVTG